MSKKKSEPKEWPFTNKEDPIKVAVRIAWNDGNCLQLAGMNLEALATLYGLRK